MKFTILSIALLLVSGSKAQFKIAENQIANGLGIITAEQAEMIYEFTKSYPNQTELSIAILENGETTFFGIKRTSDSIRHIDNKQKVFEIGSLTKVFTSTLLANLILENRIKLSDYIQEYIDFHIKTDQKITFEELANHTSGLPRLPSNLNLFTTDTKNPYKEYDEQKLKEYLTGEIKLTQKPGTRYEYSNLGSGLLGFILIEIAGVSYENLLQEKIFSSFDMTSSTTQREKVEKKLIDGLNPEGIETPNWDFNVLVGAGGILSTVKDLSKFTNGQFNEENKGLRLTQKTTFTVNDNLKIGLGWHILKRENGKDLIWHNGGTGGYTSSMALDTEYKNGVIILSNVSAFSKQMGNIDNLCFGLMETLGNK